MGAAGRRSDSCPPRGVGTPCGRLPQPGNEHQDILKHLPRYRNLGQLGCHSTARNSWWSAGPIPRARRPWLGALLLAYYDPEGRLVYAARAGTSIDHTELQQLRRRLQPLAATEMPPPRASRFGLPLGFSPFIGYDLAGAEFTHNAAGT